MEWFTVHLRIPVCVCLFVNEYVSSRIDTDENILHIHIIRMFYWQTKWFISYINLIRMHYYKNLYQIKLNPFCFHYLLYLVCDFVCAAVYLCLWIYEIMEQYLKAPFKHWAPDVNVLHEWFVCTSNMEMKIWLLSPSVLMTQCMYIEKLRRNSNKFSI